MIFSFLQYISPTWYYHLPIRRNKIPFFPDWDSLPSKKQVLLDFDESYSNYEVSKLDATWQAWNKGFICTDIENGLSETSPNPNLSDNYRFVRKYFHPFWSWYVLGLRLLSLHAPWKEIPAFWKVRMIKRYNLYERIYIHEIDFKAFESVLLEKSPKVSVIIPTLNRYTYLKDVMHDLEKQSYSNFELIVVDQSDPFQPEFYEQFQLPIQLIRQEEKALWLARNTAIQSSDADYFLLFDDDSRVETNWIGQHLKCLDYFKADISSGISISVVGSQVPKHYSFFRWSDQLDTGNVLIHRQVFEQVGLFDRQFERQRQGDGEFGLRAYLAGFKNISNPHAKRLHLKVGSGGLRQMGSWDGFRPKSWLAPRPVPSVLYLSRKYFGNKSALYLSLQSVPPSLLPYRFKRKPGILLLGFPLSLLLSPLVLWQFWRSWQVSGRMLREGARIEYLQNRMVPTSTAENQ